MPSRRYVRSVLRVLRRARLWLLVYVDDALYNATGAAGFNRTWYDGVGYSLVVPVLPGDYNDDQVVDAADYVVWRKNDANNALPNDNGQATQPQRFELWRANFGNSATGSGSAYAGSASTPEPGTLLLAVLTATVTAFARAGRAG